MSTIRPAAMLLLLAALGALAVPCCCGVRRQTRDMTIPVFDEAMLVNRENPIPPNRPKTFTTPEELRGYLDALSSYYAIAGRPRFGKRVVPVPQSAAAVYDVSSFRHRLPSDIYDLLESSQILDE